ncbi:MAG TPA: polysaccharide deacetylase family protein [Actinomycetales bacterium]|nr:polysaccharide deacetylase family protein [Actinomycetales bacterium]
MPATTAIPVLLYHCVGSDPSGWIAPFTVSADDLDRHLDMAETAGRTALTVSQLRDGLAGRRPLPARPFVITFDDGFVDTLTVAAPVLERHGVSATVYVTTGFIAASSPGGDRMLDWSQVRELADRGHEIGAHTVTHPQLDVLPAHESAKEIRGSKERLEDRLADPVRSFAYPHGYSTPRVRRQVVEAGFDSACSVKNVLSGRPDTLFSISRLTMTPDTTAPTVRQWLDGAGRVGQPDERAATRVWRSYRWMRSHRQRGLRAPVGHRS